jgi:CRISPR/Cas system-associated protein Cas10 (large subunit of type III CRISPR-Cas system)
MNEERKGWKRNDISLGNIHMNYIISDNICQEFKCVHCENSVSIEDAYDDIHNCSEKNDFSYRQSQLRLKLAEMNDKYLYNQLNIVRVLSGKEWIN